MSSTRFIFTLCLIVLVITGINGAFSQTNTARETMRVDVQFGGRTIHRMAGETGKNIDFLDYLHRGSGNSLSGVLQIGFLLSPNEHWTFDTKISLLSDLLPSQIQLLVSRHMSNLSPGWSWGLKTQIYLYPQYLDKFNQFHLLTDTGLIADLNHNYRQRILYDLGVSAMPYLKYTGRRFQATLASGIGLNSFIPFREMIAQKKPNANFRREIRYQTRFKAVLTSHTEAGITFDLYTNSRTSFGLIVRAEALLSVRNLPYKRTLFTWTDDNKHVEKINPNSRFYSKIDCSGGLFFQF